MSDVTDCAKLSMVSTESRDCTEIQSGGVTILVCGFKTIDNCAHSYWQVR
jgi:hypothetical protein